MKKNIVVAVGLALSLAGVASAQQGQGNDRGERPHRERGVDASTRGPRAERGRGGPDGLLLKGITLSEGQRTQIAQLNKTQRDAFEAKRATRQTEMEQLRAARQRGDTAALKAAMQKNRQQMTQARAQHVAAIRNLLTAEQRVQFDQNVTALQQKEAERAQRVGKRGGKGERKAKG
jgi:Spy/CpxP family protein refolding chaperone